MIYRGCALAPWLGSQTDEDGNGQHRNDKDEREPDRYQGNRKAGGGMNGL